MPIDTVAQFVQAVQQHHLLPPGQTSELARDLPRFSDVKALARELVRRDWLTPFQVNRLLQGRGQELTLGQYVLLEQIGEGGMGAVYRARHLVLDRIDAIKFIRPQLLAEPRAVQRFLREARAAARLAHPNVIAIHDAGQAGQVYYLAMEYIPGIDLGKLLKHQGPLAIPQACEYIRQAALGLQHAHERGLVHRDIKPSNLLLTANGTQVKLLDLGLARILTLDGEGQEASLTSPESMVGTPDYIAPEQARNSRNVDIRADLYGLGCCLYALLTGRPPFTGETVTEKLIKHQLDQAQPVEDLRPDVPADLAAVIRRLMAKQPEERYQTPAELVDALACFAGLAASAPMAIPVDPSVSQSESLAAHASPTVASLHYRPAESFTHLLRPGQRRWLAAAVVGGLALLIGLVWFIAAALTGGPRPTTGGGIASTRVVTSGANPKEADAYFDRGNKFYDAKEYGQAIIAYDQAIRLDPRHAGAYFQRGAAHFFSRNLDQALADNSKVIELNPTYAKAYANRGTIYAMKNQTDQAIAEFTLAIKYDPSHVSSYNNRGNAYFEKQQLDLAISDYNQAMRLEPLNVTSLTYRGAAYLEKGDLDRALADLDQAIKLDAQAAIAYHYRGRVHTKKGNLAQAAADGNRAVQLDPTLAK